MENKDIAQQFLALKDLTRRWGVLHDAQVNQLKLYPLMIDGVEKAEIAVDLEMNNIVYKCVTNKKYRNSKLAKKTMAYIYKCINDIIKDGMVVVFEVKKSKIIIDKENYENLTRGNG